MQKSIVCKIGLLFFISRFYFFAVDLLVFRMLEFVQYTHRPILVQPGFLAYLGRWDALYYHSVALEGYSFQASVGANFTFFPLYPILVRGLMGITGFSFWVCGFFLSNLFFLLATLSLYYLAKIDLSSKDSIRSIFFFLSFPIVNVFYGAIYAESLFFLLLVLSFIFARKKRWVWAGIFGLLAGLTKHIGFLIFIPILLEFLGQFKRSEVLTWFWVKKNSSNLTLTMLPILAPLAYLTFLKIKFGDFLLFFSDEQRWRQIGKPIIGFIWRFITGGYVNYVNYKTPLLQRISIISDLSAFILMGVLGAKVIRRIRPSYGILMLMMFLILCFSENPLSANRVLAFCFPIYFLVGRFATTRIRQVVLAGIFLSSSLFYHVLFVSGFWVG